MSVPNWSKIFLNLVIRTINKKDIKYLIFSVITAISLSQSANVYAAEETTLSFSSMGVENVQFPAEFFVVTKDNSYNTEELYEKYDADAAINEVQKSIDDSNIYAWAASYNQDNLIEVSFTEGDYGFNIADYKNYSSKELRKKLADSYDISKMEDLTISYEEINKIPTWKMSAYIPSLDDPYVLAYFTTSVANSKYYFDGFVLRADVKPTTVMADNIKNIVGSCNITSPPSSGTNISIKTVSKIIGTILGIIIVFLIIRFKRRKKESIEDVNNISQQNNNPAGQSKKNLVLPNDSKMVTANKNSACSQVWNEEAHLSTLLKDDTTQKLFCRKCGAELPPDSEYCNKCGAKVIK